MTKNSYTEILLECEKCHWQGTDQAATKDKEHYLRCPKCGDMLTSLEDWDFDI